MIRLPALVVLQHGHYGSCAQLAMLEHAFQRPNTTVLNVSANEGRTDDGIEAGGQRLAEAIIEHVKDHIRERHSLIFVCHSLGGLYARSALTTLAACPATAPSGPESMLQWHAFVTLCTPHLGSGRPGGTLLKTPWRWAVHTTLRIFGQTGADLAGRPAPAAAVRDAGSPDDPCLSVLEALACPRLRPARLLARFPHRIAVAMLDHDMSVPHAAAAADAHSPRRMLQGEAVSPQAPATPPATPPALARRGRPVGWRVHSFSGLCGPAASVAATCLDSFVAGSAAGEGAADPTAAAAATATTPVDRAVAGGDGTARVVDDRAEVECSARLLRWTRALGFSRLTLERTATAAWSKLTAHTWVVGCRQLGITGATEHMHAMLAEVVDSLPPVDS